ncbi:replication-associated protein [Sewage-associated circular DNA virus-4]|uniref:replication-associated protein n=1 Tax=Sewage-associated circular DNA virus-4 TaxID=1519393 RepID=UPI0004D116F2|nr:replication-associated protein [Sewage-associated circular DNA virus-4]AIF34812.1 replication-associated protein [Sewage-associated circular DNA virus-4]
MARFHAKTVFLTYPQCPVNKEDLLAWLQTLRNPIYTIVSHELHEDGSPHLHAVVCWQNKLDIRDTTFFNYENYHPNIQSARSIKKVIAYTKKDGDFIEAGDSPIVDTANTWSTAMDTATTIKEFMDTVKESNPRDYILQHERLEYFAAKHFKKDTEVYKPNFEEFILPHEVEAWLNEEFNSDKLRKKSLILIGPSKLGKTEWARSLGPHMYFNHLANFKDDWDDEAKYIVFDDFDFDFIPNKKGFFGGQQHFQITGKYMRVKSVRWGKCCIYCANVTPNIKDIDKDWYNENCVFIDVVNKFY